MPFSSASTSLGLGKRVVQELTLFIRESSDKRSQRVAEILEE
jgi:hypothetical protein